MEKNKTSRKRDPNFTANEKSLLVQLVNKRPIIVSKLADIKSVLKKKSAWISLTQEFNSNAHVHKRDTIALKRAWENFLFLTRKKRAAESVNSIETEGGPSNPPQQGEIISMVDEAAPVLICEVKKSFHSDGSVLLTIENKETEEIQVIEDKIFKNSPIDITDSSEDNQTMLTESARGSEQNTVCEAHDMEFSASATPKSTYTEWAEQCKPSDVQREAVLRLKHVMAKNKIEMQILNAKEKNKTSRKRDPNFTANEKSLLVQLVNKRPIIVSKLADIKSVLKKKSAWISLTQEFNSNAHVHKRDTIALKRAWENFLFLTRKKRAAESVNSIETEGGPSNPPQQGEIISMVDEAAPVLICEVKKSFHSDGSVLLTIENKETEEIQVLEDKIFKNSPIDITDSSEDNQTMLTESARGSEQNTVCEAHDMEFSASATPKSTYTEWAEQRKPSDVQREAVLRLKHVMAKNKIEMQILNSKLENEAIKKRAAEIEEERNRTILEISKLKKHFEIQILNAKLENEVIKKRTAEMEEERNRTLLEMSKLELAELKKRLGK